MSKQHTQADQAPPATAPAGTDATAVLLEQIRDLRAENTSLSTRNADLTAQITEVTTAAPAEGSVLLAPEQAVAWSAYQELGDPTALKTMQASFTGLQRKTIINEAAGIHDYNADVLARLIGDMPVEIASTTDAEGKAVKTATITDGENATQPLQAYVEANLAAFLPSLQATAPAGGNTGAQLPTGQKFPYQPPAPRGSNQQQGLSVVQQQLARVYKKPQAQA